MAHTKINKLRNVIGLGVVLAFHALALYGLWIHRLIPSPIEAATLFVNFIAPSAPNKADEPKRPPLPKLQPKEKPQPRQLVAKVPEVLPTDYVAPPPQPVPAPEQVTPAPQLPLPSGPVALGSELSVACPERSAPAYPSQSRYNKEMGVVVLRVELSETGYVTVATVQSSSGYTRLDEAALAAVRAWHCIPPTRNGQPVRAIALQPFNFILQGS